MFTLNSRITLTMPKGSISQAGIKAIQDLIHNTRLRYEPDWFDINPNLQHDFLPDLPLTWQWVWKVEGKGEYVGTFPKRLGKFYFQNGIKCPPQFLSQIGNIAREHSAHLDLYTFEFTAKIDWQAGDFGDSGSCYWGGNAGAIAMIENNGGLAICFYAPPGHGYARAWLAVISNDLQIVFNGYGFTGNSTLTAARVVAFHLGVSYKKIILENNGTDHGTLWINSRVGYAIGKPETIEDLRHFDLGWEDEYAYRCENCGDSVDEDYTYHGADDLPYCESCYCDLFDSCHHCGETHWNYETHYIDHEIYCDYCVSRHFTLCDECDEWVANDNLQSHNGYAVCDDCMGENGFVCDTCGQLADGLRWDGEISYCEPCYTPPTS